MAQAVHSAAKVSLPCAYVDEQSPPTVRLYRFADRAGARVRRRVRAEIPRVPPVAIDTSEIDDDIRPAFHGADAIEKADAVGDSRRARDADGVVTIGALRGEEVIDAGRGCLHCCECHWSGGDAVRSIAGGHGHGEQRDGGSTVERGIPCRWRTRRAGGKSHDLCLG